MSAPEPRTVTRYPAGEPAVYVAPDFQQIGVDQLLTNSITVGALQTQIAAMQVQIADLTSRVTALEGGQ